MAKEKTAPTCFGRPASIFGSGTITATDGDDVIVGSVGGDVMRVSEAPTASVPWLESIKCAGAWATINLTLARATTSTSAMCSRRTTSTSTAATTSCLEAMATTAWWATATYIRQRQRPGRPRRHLWRTGDDGTFADNGATGSSDRGGNDVLVGGEGDDFITGDSGIFDVGTISGDGGNDVIDAGPGNDVLLGDNSPVEGAPIGEADSDLLIAGPGDDDLVGDSRDDATLTPSGDGTDRCRGDAGSDTAVLCEVVSGVP